MANSGNPCFLKVRQFVRAFVSGDTAMFSIQTPEGTLNGTDGNKMSPEFK